ncbi:hypothetical protein GCK72_011663 [Caenorhabditis remanei]|uniref:Uncharacterized protein n=1 Tax=Caenorhabditis remanei TaxID=31234 RepID=A0A6A5H871_CAERE|nr:hypothetical protein GCK72_011663 [Caenorhabditis remanei]KAF1763397.1 hypothetical protein GCK72_011663 [Caenorhabditis remanei]
MSSSCFTSIAQILRAHHPKTPPKCLRSAEALKILNGGVPAEQNVQRNNAKTTTQEIRCSPVSSPSALLPVDLKSFIELALPNLMSYNHQFPQFSQFYPLANQIGKTVLAGLLTIINFRLNPLKFTVHNVMLGVTDNGITLYGGEYQEQSLEVVEYNTKKQLETLEQNLKIIEVHRLHRCIKFKHGFDRIRSLKTKRS